MEKAKVIDKIRKLLALAQSDNPGEAENALLMARRLMAQHKLTDRDVSDKRPNKLERVVYEGATFSGLRNTWLIDLAQVIGENHCCGVCRNGARKSTVGNIMFVGLDEDPAIALELLDYAVQHIKAKAREYRASIPDYWGTPNKNKWTRNFEANYAIGFAQGMDCKYREQNRGEDSDVMALVAVKPVEVLDFMRGLKPAVVRTRQERSNEDARRQGYNDGYTFHPTKQIETSRTKQMEA